MALLYCWSGATGTGSGADWANAKLTLTAAFVTEAAGDTIYVAHDHAENAAGSLTFTSSGTLGNVSKIICVDRAGSVPPVAADRRATATVTTTGNFNIGFNAQAHYDGIIFNCGSGSAAAQSITMHSTTNGSSIRMDNCSLRLLTTGAGSINMTGGSFGGGSSIEWNNTTVQFGAATQTIKGTGILKWTNTPAAVLGTPPTTLFIPENYYGFALECVGVDLSAMGAGKTIVGANSSAAAARFRFIDCKLDAAVTKSAAPTSGGSTEVDFIRCGANYTMQSYRLGALLTEETAIVRAAGGATDGTTPLSWKIAATANCTPSLPFVSLPIAVWNDTVGAPVTATVEGIWSGVAPPLNSECHLELEYLGDAASQMGSFSHDGPANIMTAPAAQTSSAASWNGLTAAATAWDPADKSAQSVISGLTFSASSGGAAGGRSTNPLSSGKHYFEITINNTAASGACSGIAKGGVAPDQITSNPTNGGVVVIWANGNIYAPSSTGTSLGVVANGNVICVAADLDAKLVWFRKNSGGNWNNSGTANPATGIGGISFSTVVGPYYGFTGTANGAESSTANFGATAFAGAVPSGFTAGWLLVWSPFKLDTTFTPQQKGWIYARAKIGKASNNFYLDPKVTLS